MQLRPIEFVKNLSRKINTSLELASSSARETSNQRGGNKKRLCFVCVSQCDLIGFQGEQGSG